MILGRTIAADLGSTGDRIMRRIRRGARRFVSQRRCKALLGLAAIGAFLLALPAAALACVNSCPGGTVGVNGGGFPFCQGGSNNGQLVCSGGSISFDRPFSYLDPWGWMGNSGGPVSYTHLDVYKRQI